MDGVEMMASTTREAKDDFPLVTFALFAYNQEKYIREAVEGALSQTYEPLEIILSDDCSTDRTFKIMQEMAAAYRGPHRLILRRSTPNLGLANHINAVLETAGGEIITWAAGDDIALPERTSQFVAALVRDSNTVGVHSSVVEIDEESGVVRKRVCTEQRAITLDHVMGRGESVVTQSHAFRRAVFDRFGPFRSDLSQEGIAMAFRECILGRVKFIDEPLTLYRIGSGTSTYVGGNLNKSKYTEPVKYTNWYLSAFRQMADDCNKIQLHDSEITRNKIKKSIAFYENLLAVNNGEAVVAPTLKNLLLRPTDTKTVRAAIRRYMPDSLYRVIIMR